MRHCNSVFSASDIWYLLDFDNFVKLMGAENISLMDTYQEVLKGSTVLEEVSQNLDFEISSQKLWDIIEVSLSENTDMIEIKI